MRHASFFSTSVVLAAIIAVGTANSLFAQGGRFRLEGTPAPKPPAPPVVNPSPAPTGTPAGTAQQAPPAPIPLTDAQKAEVKAIADEAAKATVAAIPAPPPPFNPASINARLDAIEARLNAPPPASWYDQFTWWHGLLMLVVVVLGFFAWKFRHKLAAGAGGLLLVSSLMGAPTVTSCRTAGGEPAFFVNDGSSSDLVCTVSGLTTVTAVTFADPALVATTPTLSGNQLKFKLVVGATAVVPNEPDMSVDSVVVGHPIAVLDRGDAGRMDLALRYLHGSGSAPTASGSDPRYSALAGEVAALKLVITGLCNGDAEWKRNAFGSKPGTSDPAGRQCASVLIAASTEATVRSKAFSDAVSAGVTAGVKAGLATLPEVDLSAYATKEEVAGVRGSVSEVISAHNALDTKVGAIGADLKTVTTTANNAHRRATLAGVAVAGPTRGQRARAKRSLADELR